MDRPFYQQRTTSIRVAAAPVVTNHAQLSPETAPVSGDLAGDLPQWDQIRWRKPPLSPGDDLLAGATLHVVKDGLHRTVYRIDAPRQSYFLKRYRVRSLWGRIRLWVRRSAAAREYAKAAMLAQRGVPSIEARGWGVAVARDNADHYLLTAALPETESLAELLEQPARLTYIQRKHLGIALARLCADAHQAGVEHDDLHPGNILVRDEQPLPRLFLIDIPGIRLGPALDWSRSRQNLGMLLAGLQAHTTAGEQLRFVREYARCRTAGTVPNSRQAVQDIRQAAHQWGIDLLLKRDKRSLADNRDFQKLPLQTATVLAVRDLDPAILRRLAADPDEPIRQFRDRPIKISHGSVIIEAQLTNREMQVEVAYKRCRVKRPWKAWIQPLRVSRAEVAWRKGHALLARGIPTARPLAVVIPHGRQQQRLSYLITAWIEDSLNLHLYAWQLIRRQPAEREQAARSCARSLGQMLGRMHAWSLSHRDLKGCNLLVRQRAGECETYLIDLDGLQFRHQLPRDIQTEDLARLATSMLMHPWVGHTLRLRFLRAYCEQQLNPPDWKPLWREIATKVYSQTTRRRKRGRELA